MKAVNLLPPELRKAPRRSGRPSGDEAVGGHGPLLILGGLALCLLALVAYVLAANQVTDRRAELEQVTADHEVAAGHAAALKPYGDFQNLAIQRRETVTSLSALRFDWEQALRDVSHALPGGVTLTALDGSISNDGATGGGRLRSAIASPAITLKGCTANQARVATMLSRLRGIRGVTRVSLAKSERKPQAQSVGTEAGPCGAGSPPDFEVVIFFERSVASAPGAEGTVAPAAVPTATGAASGGTSEAAQPATPSASPVPAP